MAQAQAATLPKTETISVRNPFSDAPVGELCVNTPAEIDAAVINAKAAASAFRFSTPATRRALLNALAAEIAADAENLARRNLDVRLRVRGHICAGDRFCRFHNPVHFRQNVFIRRGPVRGRPIA